MYWTQSMTQCKAKSSVQTMVVNPAIYTSIHCPHTDLGKTNVAER